MSGAAGNGLGYKINYLRGAAGIDLGTTIKYLRRPTSAMIKYLVNQNARAGKLGQGPIHKGWARILLKSPGV
jgi:hypothetical protein